MAALVVCFHNPTNHIIGGLVYSFYDAFQMGTIFGGFSAIFAAPALMLALHFGPTARTMAIICLPTLAWIILVTPFSFGGGWAGSYGVYFGMVVTALILAGSKRKDIRLCEACGYDLTGHFAAELTRCPECGRAPEKP